MGKKLIIIMTIFIFGNLFFVEKSTSEILNLNDVEKKYKNFLIENINEMMDSFFSEEQNGDYLSYCTVTLSQFYKKPDSFFADPIKYLNINILCGKKKKQIEKNIKTQSDESDESDEYDIQKALNVKDFYYGMRLSQLDLAQKLIIDFFLSHNFVLSSFNFYLATEEENNHYKLEFGAYYLLRGR